VKNILLNFLLFILVFTYIDNNTVYGKKTEIEEKTNNQKEKIFEKNIYGVGFEIGNSIIPSFFLDLFTKANHSTYISPSTGIKFIYRKNKIDYILKGTYWYMNLKDGVYLENGGVWSGADYLRFENLSFYYIQASIYYNKKINKRLNLYYGGGLGFGYVGGKISSTKATGCTIDNYDKEENGGCSWSLENKDYENLWFPKIMGALEISIGLKYKIEDNIYIKGETGIFLPGFLKITFSIEYYF
jgi:opacity protein-like surface antigen